MIAVYVSNAESGDISVLHLDPRRGALTAVQRVEVGGEAMPLALSPDHRRLYAVRRSEPREVLSFEIDPKSGELDVLGAAALPHSMASIATDRSGRFLFSASYGGNLVAVSPIDADGVVQAAQQVLSTGPNAHAIHADPSNRFVFATSLGGGVMTQFRFDAATGQLAPNTPPTMQPHAKASPRHFVFSRDARFVYLLNELDAAIDVLALDPRSGALRTVQTLDSLPPGFKGEPWAADLHLTPDGRFLYSSERRSGTLAAFRVDAADGTLALIGHVPTEAQPRGFNVTPDGRFLVAAGQRSHRVRLYAIDADTGSLNQLGDCAAGHGPNWIESIMLDS
ncbi:6-phosphogluconolactonase [Variovorax sp. SRS16]|uniref:lactonase family protein n=1 Tax=Variovorax sp. SRS16 TaxID=282217 RepID=UPI001319208E|nr:beta-propeller fold lactonase family protein [Variovorax sp. SRS16]VTU15865.1 6-phosphogluconolactonase [Variovorax sp. SRS16]